MLRPIRRIGILCWRLLTRNQNSLAMQHSPLPIVRGVAKSWLRIINIVPNAEESCPEWQLSLSDRTARDISSTIERQCCPHQIPILKQTGCCALSMRTAACFYFLLNTQNFLGDINRLLCILCIVVSAYFGCVLRCEHCTGAKYFTVGTRFMYCSNGFCHGRQGGGHQSR